ncbi:hypothetical protein CRM22_008666 [Opisthorchis felineus]|uniref:Amino acid transporter transmembrane domain-containing protein n=1 Tax=Opisthorchis felineus TaxID=147828 RepID=A0A4S2LAS9_OPIFE|nr:hypothetical protein CRM22_008666 [Opisthorchis felineus]TGZ60214.1 hypothetical protein CRM22_008666 [Opisthorchis felineus]
MDSGLTDSYDSTASLVNESRVSIYSPTVLGRSERGTSWYASVMIIVNAGLGASLLAFPQAYDLAGGIPISLTFQTILGVIAVGSLIILSYCADQSGTGTYQETVEACCGQRTNVTCSVVIAVYTFGCSITYLIIIGDLWDKVFDYAITDESMRRMWYLDRKFIISVSSILIILPLCIPKRIDFLRFASTVGVLGVFYIGVLIVAEYFTDLPPPGPIKTRPTHLSDIFYVLPAICFGYQCHVSAVPVYACMRGRPNVRLFSLTAGLAILLCYFSYVATGVFGYLSFGSHVSADVLVDYPARPEVVAGLALLAIKTYTTYPILHFCGRSAIQTTVLRYSPWVREHWNQIEPRWRYVSTAVWFFVSLVFALFTPDIGLVIGLLGGIAGLFILVFPGLCYLNVLLRQSPGNLSAKSSVGIAVAMLYIILGGFLFGLTTTQSIMQLIKHFSQPAISDTLVQDSLVWFSRFLTAGHVK